MSDVYAFDTDTLASISKSISGAQASWQKKRGQKKRGQHKKRGQSGFSSRRGLVGLQEE